MSRYNPSEYTFDGLAFPGNPSPHRYLAYVLGLVNGPDNPISNARKAAGLLTLLYDMEEQLKDPESLLGWQQASLPKGYLPVTPCMVTEGWSPIAAILERGLEPVLLKREPTRHATATGIWEPVDGESGLDIESAKTVEQLFWAMLLETSRRAIVRKMLVSIIACPGWGYVTAIGSLPKWGSEELKIADKILWKRTPEG